MMNNHDNGFDAYTPQNSPEDPNKVPEAADDLSRMNIPEEQPVVNEQPGLNGAAPTEGQSSYTAANDPGTAYPYSAPYQQYPTYINPAQGNGAPPAGGMYTPNPYVAQYVSHPQPPKKAPKKKKDHRKVGLGALIAAMLVCAVVGGSVASGVWLLSSGGTSSSAASATPAQNITISTSETYSDIEAVAAKVGPAVVGIRTTPASSGSNGFNFFGGGDSQDSIQEGSGVIYSADGYIITNYHVISFDDGTQATIDVFLPSDPNTPITASVVGYNSDADLAVLKIDKTGLPTVQFGNSDDCKVGENVIAIGNPGGLDFMGSVSAGIISGLNRELTGENAADIKLTQTDAAINPGNSGGALVDSQGLLIGIPSAKMAEDDFEGMGFCIPSNVAKQICDDIIANKDEPQPYFGLSISNQFDAATLQQMGYPAGAVVAAVASGSPAAQAGVQANDIITAVNGAAVASYSDFLNKAAGFKPGDVVTLTIYRGRSTVTVKVTVGSKS